VKEIDLRIVKFPSTAPVDVPQKGMATSLSHNDKRHRMTWLPQLRVVRVEFDPGDREPEVMFVPIERVESMWVKDEAQFADGPKPKAEEKPAKGKPATE
jgi:hypothetical protein